jgi:peptidoglycan/xylan/chitin deacetylase (PgdA/CDA1 family)
VSVGVFRRQMERLARDGWRTVTLSEYCSAFRVPRSAFLLTFDDAYASLAEHAYPVLADLGFTATTFVITDYVGRENTWDVRYTWRRLRHLDWDTIERWRVRGFEFASHSATHPRLTWLDDAALDDELGRSRETLTDRLGPEAGAAVAYPFGAADQRVLARAAAAGYTIGFGGPRGNAADPLYLPRSPVYAWDVGAVPCGLRDDAWGIVGRGAAAIANAAAVGTSLMLKLRRRRTYSPSTPATPIPIE